MTVNLDHCDNCRYTKPHDTMKLICEACMTKLAVNHDGYDYETIEKARLVSVEVFARQFEIDKHWLKKELYNQNAKPVAYGYNDEPLYKVTSFHEFYKQHLNDNLKAFGLQVEYLHLKAIKK